MCLYPLQTKLLLRFLLHVTPFTDVQYIFSRYSTRFIWMTNQSLAFYLNAPLRHSYQIKSGWFVKFSGPDKIVSASLQILKSIQMSSVISKNMKIYETLRWKWVEVLRPQSVINISCILIVLKETNLESNEHTHGKTGFIKFVGPNGLFVSQLGLINNPLHILKIRMRSMIQQDKKM